MAARAALAWVVQRPGITSTLMGASNVAQVHDNIASHDSRLSQAHLAELDEASAPDPKMLYSMFTRKAGSTWSLAGARFGHGLSSVRLRRSAPGAYRRGELPMVRLNAALNALSDSYPS